MVGKIIPILGMCLHSVNGAVEVEHKVDCKLNTNYIYSNHLATLADQTWHTS